MIKTKINSNKIDCNNIGKLIVALSDDLSRVRIVNATINVKINSVENAEKGFYVNFSSYDDKGEKKSSWNNIDFVSGIKAEQVIKTDISDELQDAVARGASKLELKFVTAQNEEGSAGGSISFQEDENNHVEIESISFSEYQGNGVSHSVDLKDAGNLNINLISGELSLFSSVVSCDQNVLPFKIINNYSNEKSSDFASKNNLNISQFLIKKNDDEGSLVFTYFDGNGKHQIFKESYYYEENGKKVYVEREDLAVDLDGELITQDGEKVETELVAPSGLTLVSSIEGLNGSELVDFKPEKLANVENIIKQLGETANGTMLSIESSRMQLCDSVISLCSFGKEDKIDVTAFNEMLKECLKQNQECDEEIDAKIEKVLPQDCIDSFFKKFVNGVSFKHDSVISDYKERFSKLQIKNLCENIENQIEKLEDYNNQLKKYNHQKELYDMQVPVHYLYDENGVIYGFGKTAKENIFRLVLVMDLYENMISIEHESFGSSKIKMVTDSAGKNITFHYDEDRLVSVTDARERITKFEYDTDGNIVKIIKPDGAVCRYFYSEGKLLAVINSSGFGVKISYDENQVKKVEKFSILESIKNGKPKFKTNDQSITDFSPYLLEDDFVEIFYNNLRSTTVKNGKGKCLTYLFDKLGKVRTVYENEFSETAKNQGVRAINFEYQNNKVSLKTSALPYSENFLSDVCFKERTATKVNALYFSKNTFCSDLTFPYSYITCEKFHTISSDESNKVDEMKMSENFIKKINGSENDCSHRTFIVSGWAKADSAFVFEDAEISSGLQTENDKTSNSVNDVENEYEKLRKTRRFGISVWVEYADGETKSFYASFDWRNTEWQYLSLPIRLEPKEVKKVKCFANYTNNIGSISYTDFEFKEGDYELTTCDEMNGTQISESGHSNWVVTHKFDKNKKLIKKVITNKKDENQIFETTYEYNKNGKLLKTTDHNGIVKENVYNDKGIVIKTTTYHKDEPALKFFDEKILDEKGNETIKVNELGEETSKLEYVDGTNIISKVTDENGAGTSYGYDANDVALQVATNVDGFANTNTQKFTIGHLTSLEHNDFKICYDYDDQGRVTEIKIADGNYLTKTYGEKEEITKFANGEEFKQTFNDDGSVLETFYRKDKTCEWEKVSENLYDVYGNLTFTKDSLDNGNEHKFDFNQFGKIESQTETQHGKNVSVTNTYGEEHKNITSTKVSIGDKTLTYAYGFDSDFDERLNSINLPNGKTQTIEHDKLGRLSKLSTNGFSKQFEYLSLGDHTSNLVSVEKFSLGGINGENLKYKYDSKGNITEIRKNNELLARYEYDSLSRLVREDNKALNKTTTFSYDAGGNILNKTEYPFNIVHNLDFENGTKFDYFYSNTGWRDQLKSFNGEKLIYDNLGNPMLYRDEILSWSHGRQLDRFGDIEFTYNANGIRTSKTANGTTTKFYLNGTQILRQSDGINDLTFHYGADGIVGFNLNGKEFYYKKNILGDIMSIYDEGCNEIVKYTYDAWGNHKIEVYGGSDFVDISSNKDYTNNSEFSNNRFIAEINPFRYRGYCFDSETKLYYLNSRYYDPEIGRFINADSIDILSQGKEFLNGLNLYSYCGNNPVNRTDDTGNAWWHWLIAAVVVVAAAVAVVATAGGILAGAAAVASVATGVAAGTMGATIAAGMFIGSFTALTAMTIVGGIEAINTGSIDAFWNYGETALIVTGTGGVLGALGGYLNYKQNNTFVVEHTPSKSTPYSTNVEYKRYMKVTHYDGKGNMSWSKHYTSHGFLGHSNPHWHLEDPISHIHSDPLNSFFELIKEFIKRIFK